MRKLFLTAFCAVMFATSTCRAAEDWGWRIASTFVDLCIARPFTFAATAVGAAVWTVSLPMTLPTKTSEEAFDVMVREPWRFTMDRPLGEFGE